MYLPHVVELGADSSVQVQVLIMTVLEDLQYCCLKSILVVVRPVTDIGSNLLQFSK